jgi:hypothetical protein
MTDIFTLGPHTSEYKFLLLSLSSLIFSQHKFLLLSLSLSLLRTTRERGGMEASAGLVAGSHNRNELIIIPHDGEPGVHGLSVTLLFPLI